MSYQLDISFDGREPVSQLLEKADVAVKHGVTTIWLACHLFERDPMTTAGVLLARHSRLNVVLVAVSPFVIHPVHIAMSAATLSEFFPGRVTLCLGAGAPDDLAAAGIDASQPLQTLSETLQLCRLLLSGEQISFEGRRFQVNGRALGSGRQAVPLILAATGPKMLALAGSEADGVLLSAGASREFTQWCLEQVHQGGRAQSGFQNCALVYAAVDDVPEKARARLRPKLSVTLRGSHHKRNLEAAGTELDQAALSKAVSQSRAVEAERLITDEVVHNHAVAGDASSFRNQVSLYRAAGLDRIVLASLTGPNEIGNALTILQNEKG